MLNILKFVWTGIRRCVRDDREIKARLETLCTEQSEIKHYVTLLMKAETELVEVQDFKLKRLRPSKMAWIHAAIWLILSAAAIIVGAILNSTDSSLSSQAASLHQSAQTDRVVVVEQLLEDVEPINQVNSLGTSFLSKLLQSDLLKLMDNEIKITRDNLTAAEKGMTAANTLDAQADHIDSEAGGGQLLSQISLGLGSAFFGAVLGWAITQVLAEVYRRRETKPEPPAENS